MQTSAIDLTSVLSALPSVQSWQVHGSNDGQLAEQQAFFADAFDMIKGFPAAKFAAFGPHVGALATANPQAYQEWGEALGLKMPALDSSKNQYGIASVVDIEARWSENVRPSFIQIGGDVYHAIELNEVEFYLVQLGGISWLSNPLVRLRLADDCSLWLMMISKERSGTDLACLAFALANAVRMPDQHFGQTLKLPCTNIKHDVDLSWMVGLLLDGEKPFRIQHAVQQITINMDETGADSLKPQREASSTFELGGCFFGYFTTDSGDNTSAPIAPFFASADSWRRLEE